MTDDPERISEAHGALRAPTGAPQRRTDLRRLGPELYGIAYARDEPGPELIRAALGAAESALAETAVSDGRYGLGFLGIHEGRDSNFVFVSWWENENELHHRVFFSTPELPAQLRPARPDEPIACVWDLSVIAHEREAWIRHMLANPRGADADA